MFFFLISGFLFGLGLAIANMVNPQRVLAFLDVFGVWDPTLAFVMGGALLVTVPGFYWVLKRKKPVFSQAFALPTKTSFDSSLILGAALFGLGWGLSGLCPGPVIAGLVTLDVDLLLFCVVMLAAWWATDRVLADRVFLSEK